MFSGVALAIVSLLAPPAAAQDRNPVYVETEPRAEDTLAQLPGLIRSGNLGEAVRAIQELLDESPHAVIADRGDADLFLPLDDRLHAELLASPELLGRYRLDEGARAERQLSSGEHHRVARSRLLTEAGFEATLRVTQEELESARFAAAFLALRRLESHPDRLSDADRAQDAAHSAALVASYLVGRPAPPGERPEDLASRWAQQAGLASPGFIEPDRPEGADERERWAFDPLPQADLSQLPDEPIGVVARPATSGAPRDARRRYQFGQWMFPTVVGDLILINDGKRIRAWDRFTLTEQWLVAPGGEDVGAPDLAVNRGRGDLDTSSVAASEGLAVSSTGVAPMVNPTTEPRLIAVELATGRMRWVVDPTLVDPDLQGSLLTGPVSIEEGVVIVSMRRSVRGRRLQSTHLVGFDLQTGKHLWTRLAGSAGSLPYARGRAAPPTVIARGGVAYRVDPLGVLSAIEAASGRPLWVRSDPLPGDFQGSNDGVWEGSRPVLVGNRMFCLSPERRRLLVIDTATGAVIGTRGTAQMFAPRYIVRVQEWLAAIGETHVAFLPIDGALEAEPAIAPFLNQNPPRGRAMAVGDRLMVPLTEGAILIDPERPRRGTTKLESLAQGNLVALDGQIVAASPRGVTAYLSWDVARDELRLRTQADPNDPDPPLTLAMLAYRTGRDRLIAEPLDAALAAARARGGEGDVARVFDAVRSIIETSHADAEDREDARPVNDLDIVGGLVDRMLRAAETPEQLAASLLVLGRQRELERADRDAVEAYQQLVQDVDLTSVAWSAPGRSAPAGDEAARRLLDLIAERGASVYDAFEAEAQIELELLPPAAGADAYERLASRYPASALAPDWWLRAGELHLESQRPVEAARAFNRSSMAEEASRKAGRTHPPETAAERAGAWAKAFLRSDRPEQAMIVLAEARRDGVAARVRGSIDEALRIGERSAELSREYRRLPVVGSKLDAQNVRAAPGHRLLEPMLVEGAGPRASEAVSFDETTGELWLWRSGAQGASPAWSRPFAKGVSVRLVRHDPRGVYALVNGARSIALVRLDVQSGAEVWRVDDVRSLLPGNPAGEEGDLVALSAGPRLLSELVVAGDRASLVFIERSGRAVSFDALTGRLLWADQLALGAVEDADAEGDVLAVTGRFPGEGPRADESAQATVVIDLRSGEPRHAPQMHDHIPVWTRVAGGLVLVGMEERVSAYEVVTGRRRWTYENDRLRHMHGAWVFGPQTVILVEQRRLMLLNTVTGEAINQDMQAGARVRAGRPIRAALSGTPGEGPYLFLTPSGYCGFGSRGELLAADVLGDRAPFLPGSVGARHTVLVSSTPLAIGDTDGYAVFVLESASGRVVGEPVPLLLDGQPESVRLIDGAVMISTSEGLSVIPTPPGL